jgi:protein TonB
MSLYNERLYSETILPPCQTRALPRWTMAAFIVLALHLGIGAYLIVTRDIGMPPGEPPDALMIDLSPIATAPPQPQVAAPPPEPAAPAPPPVLQAPEIPTPRPDAVVAPPPKPVPDKQAEEEQEKRLEKEKIEKQKRIEKREQARQAAPRAAAPAPGASGQSVASWKSEVQERINAAKRYPEAARARAESGAATLSFSVDSSGRVVEAHVVASSGSAALDQESVAMAHRISPLPPPPTGRVTLTVRINFTAR